MWHFSLTCLGRTSIDQHPCRWKTWMRAANNNYFAASLEIFSLNTLFKAFLFEEIIWRHYFIGIFGEPIFKIRRNLLCCTRGQNYIFRLKNYHCLLLFDHHSSIFILHDLKLSLLNLSGYSSIAHQLQTNSLGFGIEYFLSSQLVNMI